MPSPPRYLLRFIFAGLAIVLVALAYQNTRAATAAGEVERRYSFSADPTVEILQLRGMSNWGRVLSLFGDGRLTFGAKSDPDPEEYQLSYAECDELIRIAVDGGIMEHDTAKMEAIWDHIRRVSKSSSSVSNALTVRLNDYYGPDHELGGPAESVIRVTQLADAARLFPEEEDIQAMYRVAQKLRDYQRVGRPANAQTD